MSNPLDDYLEQHPPQAKTAGWFPPRPALQAVGRNVAEGAAQGGAQLLMGGAAVGLMGAAGATYRAITKKRDFQGMLQANPDLQPHHESDPVQFNRAYDSLRRMAPQFSSDPLVAGHYMRMATGGGSGDYTNAGGVMVNAAKDIRGAQQSTEFPRFPMGGGVDPRTYDFDNFPTPAMQNKQRQERRGSEY